MPEMLNPKPGYDLEERSLKFSKRINAYVKLLSQSVINYVNGKQLVRSAGSVGANYIEANEALSKKDFLMRAKIAKKEAKETRYWLILTEPMETNLPEQQYLIQEVTEIMKILGRIIENSTPKKEDKGKETARI